MSAPEEYGEEDKGRRVLSEVLEEDALLTPCAFQTAQFMRVSNRRSHTRNGCRGGCRFSRPGPDLSGRTLSNRVHWYPASRLCLFPPLWIAETLEYRHIHRIVNAKKKAIVHPVTPAPAKVRVFQEIRLQPSTSDYETFAKTTALAMGRTGIYASKPKPNRRLLSLVNLGS